MRRSTLIAAVGLTAVVGLAGCGSSKSSEASAGTTTTTAAVTVATFTQQAEAACTSFGNQMDEMMTQAVKDGSDMSTASGELAFITKGNDMLTQLISELKAIPQPAELSSQLQSIYGQLDQLESLTAQSITALQQGQTAQFNSLSDQSDPIGDSVNQAFDAIGLKSCGSGALGGSGSGSTTTTAG